MRGSSFSETRFQNSNASTDIREPSTRFQLGRLRSNCVCEHSASAHAYASRRRASSCPRESGGRGGRKRGAGGEEEARARLEELPGEERDRGLRGFSRERFDFEFDLDLLLEIDSLVAD